MKRFTLILVLCCLGFGGCSKQVLVNYPDVEKNNWVTVTLFSGEIITGNVTNAQPYILTIQDKRGRQRSVEASQVNKIKRIPSYYDDFGNAISENDIAKVRTNRNTTIFGFGGGLLSFSTSFFIGSLIAQNTKDGGPALLATTAAGGILGTVFFIQAGRRQDRKEAALKIRNQRKSTQIDRSQKQSLDEIRKEVDDEKKKQEELRRQRERLLKELEDSRKQKD
jgi:hypothetical protein